MATSDTQEAQSFFGRAARFAREAGHHQDILMRPFLECCAAYREGLNNMGMAAKMGVADFDKNYVPVKSFFHEDEEGRSTWGTICKHSAAPVVSMKWLLYGLSFFLTYLEKLWEGDRDAPGIAYRQTLSRHHNWWQSTGFKVVLSTLPSRETLLNQSSLCLNCASDQVSTVLDRDTKDMLSVMPHIVRSAQTQVEEMHGEQTG